VSDLAIGIDFAGCRVEELIGRGGMGVVYRGTDLRLDRPVAIKLIATEHAAEESVRRRFEREARLMASIDHPNVIPVYAAGEQDGHLYLVMRYIAGTDLHALLKRRGRLAPGEAARIVAQLAGALDAAHQAGLVHRDIKPANVLLSDDHVYLTDFGITRAVDTGTRVTDSDEWVGTVDYMSPEHLRGASTDARSDVYSLGCLLYASLTGSPPFRRGTAAATILAHIEERPPKPSDTAGVPPAFDRVTNRALAKRPADRYASAGELGTAALGAASGRARPKRAPKRTEATKAHPRKNDEQTRVLGPPTAATARLRFYADRRRARTVVVAILVLLVAAALAITSALILKPSKVIPAGPLTARESLAAANNFAAAYGHRDTAALTGILAPGVTRIASTTQQVGRAAVVAEYAQQFKANPIQAYELQNPVVTPGNVGRVAAHYTVLLKGRTPITGTVVFGVERRDGRPVIGLIATQQTG
jgi:serine/threonine-protein kinase